MSPKRTKCAAISAASSLATIDVKSHNHSNAATAEKQCVYVNVMFFPETWGGRSWTSKIGIPFERSWYSAPGSVFGMYSGM